MMLCAWLNSRIFPICGRSQVGIWAKNRKERPSSAYAIHSNDIRFVQLKLTTYLATAR
jgi:hypothetical protein